MKTEPGDRMLQALPALYAAADARRHELRQLLAVFEALFFDAAGAGELVGVEARVDALPSLFVPAEAPAAFVQWMAAWLGFTPHAHFDEACLRRIVPGLVNLYSRRGTRGYLVDLLHLCFDEVETVDIDDRPPAGFVVGRARVGTGTRLERASPFRFAVQARPRSGQAPTAALERRLRAVIDFAKPAHTRYEFSWAAPGAPHADRRSPPPMPHRHPPAGSTAP